MNCGNFYRAPAQYDVNIRSELLASYKFPNWHLETGNLGRSGFKIPERLEPPTGGGGILRKTNALRLVTSAAANFESASSSTV